jgi:hypothetical protein
MGGGIGHPSGPPPLPPTLQAPSQPELDLHCSSDMKACMGGELGPPNWSITFMQVCGA